MVSGAKMAADALGYNASVIRSACNGKRKTAYGYKWKYYNARGIDAR